MAGGAFALFVAGLAVVAAVLLIIFVLVPVLRGVGWMIGGFFKGIGWLIAHIFEFIFGMIGDAIRLVGTIPVMLVFTLLATFNVLIGRWGAAGHYADSFKRECRVGGACVYRVLLRRPLKLILMHGLLEGMEERIPAAMAEAPGRDTPSGRTGQFEGYTIVGSLRGGGSGGKLYIAEPTPEKRAAIPTIPDRVVIKSFALTDGSSLPQIVRESRALECAKSLGHVIEHGMTAHRFHYVMPYIPGDHLGVITRDFHQISGDNGLNRKTLRKGLGYISDLLATLSAYHKGGFWHKDIKPENIIVQHERAHVVDLGLVTPLSSAMTLTTHGTEYFRDPEMVRQALRGVKVHQVDGAKFDLYAAGAVLYFMLENTFPAHGGLSSFNKKSPEAMRWIIRRAMAEYHQRYTSADQMLADLHAVAVADDPFSVKPVDLPSMQGSEIPEVPVEAPKVERVVSAGAPLPPHRESDVHSHAAGAGIGAAAAAAGGAGGTERRRAATPRRPRLHVTNWWTGQYVVEDDGHGNGPIGEGEPPEYPFGNVQPTRAPGRTPGATPGGFPHAARTGAQHARRTAREQVKSARARAHDMRERMKKRRHDYRSKAERAPGIVLGIMVFFVIAIVIGIATLAYFLVENRSDLRMAFSGANIQSHEGAPVLTITDISNWSTRTHERVHGIMRDHRRDGYDVFLADSAMNEQVLPLVKSWDQDRTQGGPYDIALEDAMESHNIYGVLLISQDDDGGLNDLFVYSTRPGAEQRRRTTNMAQSVLLINDLPRTNGVPDFVYRAIRREIGAYRSVVQHSGVSDAIRPLLADANAGATYARDQINRMLDQHNCYAVLWIQPDDESPVDSYRTHIYLKDRDRAGGGRFLPEIPDPAFGGEQLLLVNDHPSTDPAVRECIDDVITRYEERGYEIVMQNVDLESEVRIALELLKTDPALGDERFDDLLTTNDFGGVLRINAMLQDGAPTTECTAELIRVE